MPSQVIARRKTQSPKHLEEEQQDSSPGISAVSVSVILECCRQLRIAVTPMDLHALADFLFRGFNSSRSQLAPVIGT